MTYIKQNAAGHHCRTPYIRGHEDDGDIWECDECGQQWKAHYPGNPDYSRWSKVLFRRRSPK